MIIKTINQTKENLFNKDFFNIKKESVFNFFNIKKESLFNKDFFKCINSSHFKELQDSLFNCLENKENLQENLQIFESEEITDIFKNLNIFVEENSYILLCIILSILSLVLALLYKIYKNQNLNSKKKMSLKEFIKFLKRFYSFLLYILYVLLLFLFYIFILKIKNDAINLFKGLKGLHKTYNRLIRLFSRVEFLEKVQKLSFDKINEDIENLYEIFNDHLAPEIINLKEELEKVKKDIIDINSNIITF